MTHQPIFDMFNLPQRYHRNSNGSRDFSLPDKYTGPQSISKYLEQEEAKLDERRRARFAQERLLQREPTQNEILEISLNEEKMTNEIRAFISDRQMLTDVLSELKDVNPEDPIFDQFYS